MIKNNDVIYTNVEKYMLDAIKNSNYIEHVMMSDFLDECSRDQILDMINSPKPFKITDEGLVYTNSDGIDVKCPDYNLNTTADGIWLSEKIMPVTFDIEQSGNLRKASEAQAAYCLSTIYCVLGDDAIKLEIEEIINNYDYSNMSPFNGFMSFTQLLEVYQGLQSIAINICIAASKYKIADIKKDSEKYLKEDIPEERIAGLRELDTSISSINRRYSLGPLSPDNVKGLKKIEILNILEEKNREISFLLNGGHDSSNVLQPPHKSATLWKILSLSSEYVSPIIKRRLNLLAEKEVSKLFAQNPKLSFEYNEQKQLSDVWKKRYIKIACVSVRKVQLGKYLSDEGSYKLPVKL